MKNSAGLFKGRIRLAEKVYKAALGKDLIILPDGEF